MAKNNKSSNSGKAKGNNNNNVKKVTQREVKRIVNNEIAKTTIKRQVPFQAWGYPVQNDIDHRWATLFPLRGVILRLASKLSLAPSHGDEFTIYLHHMAVTASIHGIVNSDDVAIASILSGGMYHCWKKNLTFPESITFTQFSHDGVAPTKNFAKNLVNNELCAGVDLNNNNFWDSQTHHPSFGFRGPNAGTWPLRKITNEQNQRSGFGVTTPYGGQWATKISRQRIWAKSNAANTQVSQDLNKIICSPKEPMKIKLSYQGTDGWRISDEPVMVLALDKLRDDPNQDLCYVSVNVDCTLSTEF